MEEERQYAYELFLDKMKTDHQMETVENLLTYLLFYDRKIEVDFLGPEGKNKIKYILEMRRREMPL